MPDTPMRPPITILGAGISGLTLGQCLRKHNIPTIIYDKVSQEAPRHSYGITLHSWSYLPLTQSIGRSPESFRHQTIIDRVRRNNPKKHEHGHTELIYPAQLTGLSFRANRAALESYLATGLDIRYDHAVSGVYLGPPPPTTTPSPTSPSTPASLTVTFTNGTSINPPGLLIDCLGVHSALRTSLLPTTSPTILPYVVFNGRRRVSADEWTPTYRHPLQMGAVLPHQPERSPGVLLQLALNDYFEEHGGASISWTYSRPARESGGDDDDDPLHRPQRAQDAAKETPRTLWEELRALGRLPEPWWSATRRKQGSEDRVLHWLMRSMLVGREELDELAERGVVLLGDSAHATPILGGEGANMAIVDGVELAGMVKGLGDWELGRELVEGLDGKENVAWRESVQGSEMRELVQRFYAKRYQAWREGVEASEMRIREMHEVKTWRGVL